jgi:hypothetical protein
VASLDQRVDLVEQVQDEHARALSFLEGWQRDTAGHLTELTLTAMILSRDHREQLVTDRDNPQDTGLPAPAFAPPLDPMEAHLRFLRDKDAEVMIRLARITGRDAVAGTVYAVADGLVIVQEKFYGGSTGRPLGRWAFRLSDVVSVEEA